MAYKTSEEIRNHPNQNDELEIQYAQIEARAAAGKLLKQYSKEPNFLKAVLVETANKLIPKHKDQAKDNGDI